MCQIHTLHFYIRAYKSTSVSTVLECLFATPSISIFFGELLFLNLLDDGDFKYLKRKTSRTRKAIKSRYSNPFVSKILTYVYVSMFSSPVCPFHFHSRDFFITGMRVTTQRKTHISIKIIIRVTTISCHDG